ncbi:GntR family transcriptional regulator [Sphingomonas panacisoli]|uniref:GntR family transcriptional regulator n=1 Tax=Sphingomonas panacisoli TaxID=1813879 RepID=A0A5B8LIX2_9SPHN|nr:GntR family transcriptional regulator [Sphingomonas panacisoli]QDZ08133.1 GntR family transcriptional regulator [Sphingomonas panacisoli]
MAKSRYPNGARDLAVARMHAELRQGRWAPGAALDATALAAEFGMSASPVREALALLLGARVIEASHRNGFSVPRLMPHELAEEYRLLAMIADGLVRLEAPFPSDRDDPMTDTSLGRLIWALACRTGATATIPIIATTTLRIANYVRAEPAVLVDCDEEAAALARALAEGGQAPLRDALQIAFHRRISATAAICRAAEKRSKRIGALFE